MSVTVADCLKLPALKEACVVAGENGLNRIVTAISVLEYVDFAVLAHDFFIGNELIITAFVCVKDDVEAQCKTIHRLSEAGEVGLIVYYVGIFVPALDDRLLQTANELDFPIIRMPLDRLDFRYSDVISEVLEAIFKDQMKETYFVNGMLARLSQLKEPRRTLGTVLRMLSDHLRCTLLLCDSSFKQMGFATWPMSNSMSYEDVMELFKDASGTSEAGGVFSVGAPERKMRLFHLRLNNGEYKDIGLIAIDEAGVLDGQDLKQAVELLLLFTSIWKHSFNGERVDSLIPAILNDNPDRMHQTAKALNIDVASINTMWIIRTEDENLSPTERRICNERIMVKAKFFLREHGKALLVDIYENNVIILLGSAKHADLDEGIANGFSQIISSMDIPFSFTICANLLNTSDTRSAYLLFTDCIDTVRRIYPVSSLFSTFELQFAMECMWIIKQGEESLGQHLEALRLLRTQDDGQDLIDTLAVYLLDAASNAQDTGELLFLHKNTVKYRLNKIKQRLDYDITKMPEAYNLYRAVALERLVKLGS